MYNLYDRLHEENDEDDAEDDDDEDDDEEEGEREEESTVYSTTDDIRNVTEARLPQLKQTLRSTDGIQMEKKCGKFHNSTKFKMGQFSTLFLMCDLDPSNSVT